MESSKKTIELKGTNYQFLKIKDNVIIIIDEEFVNYKLESAKEMTAVITGDGVTLRFEVDA